MNADASTGKIRSGSRLRQYVVCPVKELPPGGRRIVEAGGRSIGVFNVHGRYYALRNTCPHQSAPLCIGPVTGTNVPLGPYELSYERDGEIVRCPWHGWEFDILTGRSIFNPHKVRVRSFEVTTGSAGADLLRTDDVRLETFEVTVEDDIVILHA